MRDDSPCEDPSKKSSEGDGKPTQPPGGSAKVAVGLVVAAVIVIAVVLFQDQLSIGYLAEQETAFQAYQSAHPILVYGIAFGIYVVVTGLSLPGAAALTILCGWLFDWWQAVVLVSFASTTGATLAFLLSRYLFRDSIQGKFGDRLANFNDALAREGAFYLFTLRLIVGVPFFIINVVMGLTPIKTPTFWWVSQLGMLPGTALYTYIGSAVPNLQTLADQGAKAVFSGSQLLQFSIAFGLLGVFPWFAKWGIAKLRPERP